MFWRFLLAAWLLLAAAADARCFTVEDILAEESWGRAAFDPTGRWLLVERIGPHAASPSFDLEPYGDLATTRILAIDVPAVGAPRPLIVGDPRGVTLGPVSPDGRQVAVYRLAPRRWDLGVVKIASGRVRWLPVTPDMPLAGRTAQWKDDRTLLVVARAPGDRPRELDLLREAAARLPARWAAAARGELAVTVVGSGRDLGLRPRAPPKRLLQIDVASGRTRLLMTGDLDDIEISPDGAQVAVLVGGTDIPLAADRPLQGDYGTTTQQREVRLLDLASGRASAATPGWDVQQRLLSWSPSGRELLVFARRPGAAWTDGRFLRVPVAGAPEALDLGGARPWLSYRPETARALWTRDGRPLVRTVANGAAGWRLVGDETAPLPWIRAPDVVVGGPHDAIAIADGAAWRIDAHGAVRLAGMPSGLQRVDLATGRFERRLSMNPPRDATPLMASGVGDGIALVDDAGASVVLRSARAGAPVLAASLAAKAVAQSQTDVLGVSRLWLSGPQGSRLIGTANAGHRDLDRAAVVPITHPGPDEGSLTSWLYLPTAVAGPRPLIVIPYLGSTYRRAPRPYEGRWAFGTPSVAVLVGAGYAVLIPSLPLPAGREPLDGLGARLGGIVDAALAQAPPNTLDAGRTALFGHSYGGYTVLAALTQTPRFKAAIAVSPPTDLVGMWGVAAPTWLNVDDGLGVAWAAGWTETSQGSMGGPPWSDPSRYVRNSPIFAADKIRTPLLLVRGDRDSIPPGQTDEMFAALYRQGRDAQLVTYWGEAHEVRSPANLRDVYRRAFGWLNRAFDAEGDPAARPPHPACASASSAPSSRSSRP